MKHPLLVLILSCTYLYCSAQARAINISQIQNSSEAEKYIKANPNSEGKVFHISFGSDAAEIFSQLANKKPGYTFKVANYTYKLLEFDSLLCNRVSYIYLDGSKMNKNEIDKLRQLIILKYKAGTSFTELVTQYNMDGNTSGDTGWFEENVMAKEVESAIKMHKKDEIFTVDTPSANWYHVVLKTYNAAYKMNFSILKVKTSS